MAIFYLSIIGPVYVPTIGLWVNITGLRALRVDLPPSASDAAFQAKVMADFLAGVMMLAGCAGLRRWLDWRRTVTVIGLLCQMIIYDAEVAIFRYLNALGAVAY